MSILQPEENKPYTALYRQWRPQCFAQVVGQEHVTRTLQNALEGDRVAHAYLFCGLRGTGKTTMAKLLAKALNCLEGVNREPCNNCRACREIAEGRSMDVQEIDAASNRGIDEIRELREKVRYAAARNRYKVYIIDEVHMLTNEAFNALLKTLEEPPSGVVFILATTEVHKLPLTIISRCQRFDFHLLQVAEIAGLLAKIASQIKFAVAKETLYLLARLAEGSLRDALGFLEQCRAFGGEQISYEQALEILGLTAPEAVFHLLQSVVNEKVADGLFIVQEIVHRGRDLHRFIRELILYLRKLLILQTGAGEEEILKDVPGLKPLLLQQKNAFTSAVLLEMLEILQQLTFELKGSAQPQFLLELALLRLSRAYRFRDYFSPGTLLSHLEELDEKLQSAGLAGLAAGASPLPPVGAGKVPEADAEILAASAASTVIEKKELVPGNPATSTVADGKELVCKTGSVINIGPTIDASTFASEKKNISRDPATPAVIEEKEIAFADSDAGPGKGPLEIDPGALQAFWDQQLLPELKKQRKHIVHALLQEGRPFSYETGIFTISLPPTHSVHKSRIESKGHSSYIESLLEQLLGRETRLKIILEGKAGGNDQREAVTKETGEEKTISPLGKAKKSGADRGNTGQGDADQANAAWNNAAQNNAHQNIAGQGHAVRNNTDRGHAEQTGDSHFFRQMLELFDGRLIETGIETLGSREFWSFNLEEVDLDLPEEDEVPF